MKDKELSYIGRDRGNITDFNVGAWTGHKKDRNGKTDKIQIVCNLANGKYCVARFQNEPHQDVLLWYVDCFELRTILALGSRETSSPPLIT